MIFDVVVVGGGAAGVDAATAVRESAPEARVALVSPQCDLLYRPWLVYLPATAVPEGDLSIPLADIASRHGFQHVKDTVTTVDPEAGEVVLGSTGERLHYGQLILAPGAPADRGRIPGGDQHALFPCDPEEAHELIQQLSGLTGGAVAFVLTGERIGPGLEYAGWIARGLRSAGSKATRVVVLEDGDAMDSQFGTRSADRLVDIAGTVGVEVIRHAGIERIESSKLILADAAAVSADLIAVTSPLRGLDLGLPTDLLNARGMLKVDATLSVPSYRNVFAAGDFSDVQGIGLDLPKTWMMARLQAETAARNAAAGLHGVDQAELDMRKVTRMAALSMPDVGGQTLLVRNRKPVVAGSWPLRLRYRMDGKYLSRYRSRPGVTRPAAPTDG
jgi:NADH dehydrogenase FAD-containing subunit